MKRTVHDCINIAGIMKLSDGSTRNYGGIEVLENNFIYYTGKGLREIFREKKKELLELSREVLIEGGYIGVIPVNNIVSL